MTTQELQDKITDLAGKGDVGCSYYQAMQRELNGRSYVGVDPAAPGEDKTVYSEATPNDQ